MLNFFLKSTGLKSSKKEEKAESSSDKVNKAAGTDTTIKASPSLPISKEKSKKDTTISVKIAGKPNKVVKASNTKTTSVSRGAAVINAISKKIMKSESTNDDQPAPKVIPGQSLLPTLSASVVNSVNSQDQELPSREQIQKSIGVRKGGKVWKETKKPLRIKAVGIRHKSWEKKMQERLALQGFKEKAKELKEEKEQEKKVGVSDGFSHIFGNFHLAIIKLKLT